MDQTMRRSICWLMSVFCTGTALGQSTVDSAADRIDPPCSQTAPDRDPLEPVETLVRQPRVQENEVDDRVIGEVRPAGGKFLVRLANMGEDADRAAIGWDVGRYTGFRPAGSESRSLYQRGPRQAAEGTAVQLRGTEIGIWVDSDHPRPGQGALIPVCPAYWWWDVKTAPRPFQDPRHQLSFALDMQVPTAEREGEAEVYICAYFLLRDPRSGRQFWLGATLFDPRGAARFPDLVHFDDWEGGTRLPILFTALNDHSAWLHPAPGSAHFAHEPFTSYRRFEFRVGSQELLTAVHAMKGRWPDWAEASEDPSDYQLTHFNVNPEVYAPAGSRGRLGLALRDIHIQILEPTAR
ncbi:MAG: hypothetical protein ACYC0X_12720 [Pirellulaceae bacterium]